MRVLLVYKRSTYDFYVLNGDVDNLDYHTKKKLQDAHLANQEAILEVEKIIAEHCHFDYKKVYRANVEDAEAFDVVVAVGGDGTFLEASRCITDQYIIGVNSDPNRSYGNYCMGIDEFRQIMDMYDWANNAEIIERNRMIISINGKEHDFPALNDVLICHACPAGLTRYEISYKSDPEDMEDGFTKMEHFNSGIWVSTASGSTGAISSFGGLEIDPNNKDRLHRNVKTFYGLQFKAFGMNKNKNTGANEQDMDFCNAFNFTSKMREGKIYVDGQHVEIDFPYNSNLRLSSGKPLVHIVGVKKDEHIEQG
jgi:NAD+ kinase